MSIFFVKNFINNFRKTYCTLGMGQVFSNKAQFAPNNSSIIYRNGFAKGVRITENNGKPNPGLVVDCKFLL